MSIKLFFSKLFITIYNKSKQTIHLAKIREMHNVSRSASFGVESSFMGNVNNLFVGPLTYSNKVNIDCGENSIINIGSGCAIGYNVSIKSRTHSLNKPTNNELGRLIHIEKDITIGDDCWIGDNVFIREGVTIGDKCIIGANSVVTKSFPPNVIIAGIPGKIIRENKAKTN